MTLKENIQPIEIDFFLDETGLNVYSELEINLPVNVQEGLVFDIDQIEFQQTPAFDPAAAGAVFQAWQLTFNTQAALLNWSDSQILAAGSKNAHASAALLHSGSETYELHTDTRGRANLVARSSIFLGIDSQNTTVVWRMQGRLIGSLVKIDQKALTQLVLNQLT